MANDNLFSLDSDISSFFDLEEKEKINSDALDSRQAGLAAFVDKQTTNKPLSESLIMRKEQTKLDPSHENIRREVASNVVAQQKQDLQNVVENFFSEGNLEKTVEASNAARELSQELDESTENKSIEESFVDSMGYTLDQKRAQEQQFRLEVSRDVMKLLDEQDLTDKVVNYSGLLLSDVTLDLSRVTGTSYLKTPEAVGEFLETWHGLPVDMKRRLYPELKAAIHEATDQNNVKTAFNILRFIDPEAPDDIETELTIDQILLGVDVGTLGATMVSKLYRIAKAANVVKALKDVGNIKEAANLNIASMLDETGEVVDVTKTDAYTAQANGTGFKMEDIMPESTDGINVDVERVLREVEVGRNKTVQKLSTLLTGEGILKETAFTSKQIERIQSKAMKEMEELSDEVFATQGWDISNIRVSKSDGQGFTLEYDYAGVPSSKSYTYKLSDVGTFDELATGAVEKGITSPSVYLKGVDERFVEKATNIELTRMKVLDVFNRTVKDIMDNTLGSPLLHKKAYQDLDAVLLAGDDYLNADGTAGKLYKVDELLTGVDTARGTVRLNEKQVVAYYRLRDLFDNLGVLKNNELRKTLELNGFKDIAFEGIKTIGKPFERHIDAINSLNKRRANVIYDPTADKGMGRVVNLSEVNMKDMYDKGFRVVRFQENEAAGNQFVTHALVKLDDIKNLPLQVMHYKKGYVPKIYKEGHYFVKQELKGTLNGRAGEIVGMKTLRMFDSKKGAENYMATLQAENPNTIYRLLHDREMSSVQLANESVGLSGGLYTSPRAKHAILFNEEGLPPPRLTAFEALQRNLQHLSNYLPRNEWRIGMQQKWINTAREQGMLDGSDFNAALLGERHTPEWNALNSAREYIRDQIRIPTSEERWFEAKIRGLAEWAENPIQLGSAQITSKRLPDFARKSLLTFAHTDPFALARSTAFHSLLGWFNPAQLFVQAQGASIAISLHPELAPKAFQKYMALRPLMHLTKTNADMATARKMSDNIAKATGIKPDELWEDFQVWQKTGLQESIKATADHAAAAQNFGVGAQAFRDVADKGLVFYREGELFTRGIAFSIAKSKWRKANKGKAIDDESLKLILDDAMRMQLNLTRANRAAWQKGKWSIPTQFLQIQTKFLEKIWFDVLGGKSELTFAKKMQLLSMQFAIYGSAGVPFSNWAVNEGAQILGISPEEMTPELKRYLSGGFWDLMLYQTFGADVEVGRRGAVVSGIEDFFKSLIYEKAPFADSLLGAFGEIPTRSFNAIGKLAPLVSDPSNIDFTPQELALAASELGTIVSTWRNVDKAIYMARFGQILDKHGNIVVDRSFDGGFEPAEVVLQGLGFQLKDVKGVYDLNQLNKNWDEHINKRVDSVINLHYWYLSNVDHEGAGRNLEVMQQVILGDLSDYEQTRVLQLVQKRLSKPKNKEEQALNKYYNDIAGDVVRLNPYFSGPYTNTIIPEDKGEE